MPIKFYYSSILIEELIILISLLISIIFWKRIKYYDYLKWLPLYISISFLTDKFLLIPHFKYIPIIQNFFTVSEFSIFYFFFWKILNEKIFHKILTILIIVFFAFIIFEYVIRFSSTYYVNEISSPFFKIFLTTSQEFENIFLIIPPLIYYKSLFQKPSIQMLISDPTFLVMTGILFCFFISMPYTFISQNMSLKSNRLPYLSIINSISYITMHIFFIIAIIKTKKNV